MTSSPGEPISRFAEVNGSIRLHYLVWPGDGPTLLCTHGLAYNAWLFGRFGRHLAPEYTVVSVDLRGHGDSDRPKTGYHYADEARDMVDLARHLGGPPPTLIGHSHGGRIGHYTAATLPARSHASCSPTSASTGPRPTLPARCARHNMTGVRFADWDSYLETMRRSRFHRNWTPDMERFLRFNAEVKPDGQIGPKLPPEAAGESYQCLEDYDLVPDLARIAVPIGIVRAGEGNNTDEMAATMRRQMPQLLAELIPDANHNLVLDRPDQFEALARRILDRLAEGRVDADRRGPRQAAW